MFAKALASHIFHLQHFTCDKFSWTPRPDLMSEKVSWNPSLIGTRFNNLYPYLRQFYLNACCIEHYKSGGWQDVANQTNVRQN